MTTPINYIISIDIGMENMAYAVIPYSDKLENGAEINIINVDSTYPKKMGCVIGRTYVVCNMLNELLIKYPSVNIIVVEKQIVSNVKAMSIMYSIATWATMKSIPIIIYPPKNKFTDIHESYVTRGKAHKRKSINMASNLIESYYVELKEYFVQSKKQDDLSDSLLQGVIYLISAKKVSNNITWIRRAMNLD